MPGAARTIQRMGLPDAKVPWGPTDAEAEAAPQGAPADLVALLGGEVAAVLTSALERVGALAQTGRIDRAGLRSLREEIDHARRLGMMGQQFSRFASGEITQAAEAVDLTGLLRDVLAQRGREIERRGIEVRQVLRPAVVMADPTLLHSLFHALFDWAFQHTRSRIELQVDRSGWPANARLVCSFAVLPADEIATGPAPLDTGSLHTLSWHVLQQTAGLLGLPLLHDDDEPGRTRVTLEFPHTVAQALEGEPTRIALAVGAPLDGAHLLVVAAQREVRNLVRNTLNVPSMMIDYVTSVEEAREFCRRARPDVVLHEAALGGESLERLRAELRAARPPVGMVQITEDSKGFELRNVGGEQRPTIGRAAIPEALTAALGYALIR